MSKDADILQMRMQIIGMSEDIHNYQAALAEKEAELAAAREALESIKSWCEASVCEICGEKKMTETDCYDYVCKALKEYKK
jgi:ribosomal protein L32